MTALGPLTIVSPVQNVEPDSPQMAPAAVQSTTLTVPLPLDRIEPSSGGEGEQLAIVPVRAPRIEPTKAATGDFPFGSAGEAWVKGNVEAAKAHHLEGSVLNPFSAQHNLASMQWLFDQVNTGKEQDPKNWPPDKQHRIFPQPSGMSDAQYHQRLDDLGQINYGAVGVAIGLDPTLVLKNAYTPKGPNAGPEDPTHPGDPGGYVEWGGKRFHWSTSDGTPPYWDKPQDQAWIQRGIEFEQKLKP